MTIQPIKDLKKRLKRRLATAGKTHVLLQNTPFCVIMSEPG
jgi:hypothetical protein